MLPAHHFYQDMLFAMNMQHGDYSETTQAAYDSQRDDVLAKSMEEREQLKQELEQVRCGAVRCCAVLCGAVLVVL
jgi:hypothetical protein